VAHALPRNRLALAALGYDVLCTDVPPVLPLLRANVARNASALPESAGTVQVRELDWTVHPEHWRWDDARAIASQAPSPSAPTEQDLLSPPFDLIVTADTLYAPHLTDPLLRTLRHLLSLSARRSAQPPTYVALERRDPALVDAALAAATARWGMTCARVPHGAVAKAMRRGGVEWDAEEWEGVEIWKFALSAKGAAMRVP
jgi:hypothetical protein